MNYGTLLYFLIFGLRWVFSSDYHGVFDDEDEDDEKQALFQSSKSSTDIMISLSSEQ